MEARMQAELLYALRAITRYMTWSAFGVFIIVFFYCHCCCLFWENHILAETSKNRCEEPYDMTMLIWCWIVVKKKNKEESSQRHRPSLCSLQCQTWPGEGSWGSLLYCGECARPQHWHQTHPEWHFSISTCNTLVANSHCLWRRRGPQTVYVNCAATTSLHFDFVSLFDV